MANSKLIELYLNLEPNLRKFLFILRYWMKHKNLSSSKFNGYITTWMAIFYMQKKNIGFLPTVQHLADMKGMFIFLFISAYFDFKRKLFIKEAKRWFTAGIVNSKVTCRKF